MGKVILMLLPVNNWGLSFCTDSSNGYMTFGEILDNVFLVFIYAILIIHLEKSRFDFHMSPNLKKRVAIFEKTLFLLFFIFLLKNI
jgi:hypothetical protein